MEQIWLQNICVQFVTPSSQDYKREIVYFMSDPYHNRKVYRYGGSLDLEIL